MVGSQTVVKSTQHRGTLPETAQIYLVFGFNFFFIIMLSETFYCQSFHDTYIQSLKPISGGNLQLKRLDSDLVPSGPGVRDRGPLMKGQLHRRKAVLTPRCSTVSHLHTHITHMVQPRLPDVSPIHDLHGVTAAGGQTLDSPSRNFLDFLQDSIPAGSNGMMA